MNFNTDFISPNCTKRYDKIDFIIIHYTEMTFKGALDRLCDQNAEVSAHYLIRDDGHIFNLVKDELCAWHAGQSSWQGITSLNKYSIGIEMDNIGYGEYNNNQIISCIKLLVSFESLMHSPAVRCNSE